MRGKIRKLQNIKRREKYFENVTVEIIGLEQDELENRLCAVIRTLLEIDDWLNAGESDEELTKGAA